MTYPIPENEAERLAELHALDLLKLGRSAPLDELCTLARQILNVAFACVALLDRDRQVLVGQSGFDGFFSVPRDSAMSAWAVTGSQMMIVPDARQDERFASFPNVVGEPFISLFVGAPLALRDGLNIGSFCLFDNVPREFTPGEIAVVEHLARIIVDQFRLHEATRRAKRELEHRRIGQSLLEMQSRELWRRQTLLAQTERLAQIGGWELDVPTGRLSWSDGVYRIYGLTPGREISTELALSHFPPEARAQFTRRFELALKQQESFDIELPFVNAHGHHRLVRKSCQIESEGTRAVRAFGILQDITEQKEAEQRMWHMANHDALTGLPNRGLMRDQLDAALRRARRSGTHVGLLLVDLDHFKDVNDTLGHDAGDALLVEAARRLTNCVREVDTVARLGGDEFIIVLTGMEASSDAMIAAQRILATLALPFSFRRSSLSCRGSIGVTVSPEHGIDASTLLKNADIALYRAKAAGRGVAVEYDPQMQLATENRIQFSTRVRQALEASEFVPYYQPKICLDTGAIIGFEALLRWRHPRKGVLGPQKFGQIFEDPDLSVAIGERMLELTTRDMANWRASGCAFGHVAVNVSSGEFARGELPDRVLNALDAAGLPPECLVIEVTETVFLGRTAETVRRSLQTLHQAGVLIALDDFGTGYASLSHLRQFPVDRIKIDRSFVQDIEHDEDDAAIVRAVINLGRSLGIETVAEGVETAAQATYLRNNGCDFAQGFLYSKAIPAARIPSLLRNWNPAQVVLQASQTLDRVL